MKPKVLQTIIMTALLVLLVPPAVHGGSPTVDLKRLSTELDNWDAVSSGGDAREGYQLMKNTVWAMYHLHWLPAGELKKADPSEEILRGSLDKIWGDRKPDFEVEATGKCKIHGHKGFFLEGMRKGEAHWSRFTLFICPKSDRLFISEITLDRGLGTPETLTELLLEVERTISCHGINRRISNPKVPLKMNFPGDNLSFHIPNGWRSDVFGEGNTPEEGHVWTLPVNSLQTVLLSWTAGEGKVSTAAGKALEQWKTVLFEEKEGRELEQQPEDLAPGEDGDGYLVTGSMLAKDPDPDNNTGKHDFRMRLWQRNGSWHTVIYSILSRDTFMDQRVYLQSDDQSFLDLEDRLARAVDGFPSP